MKMSWLSVGIALAVLGCGSKTSETPGAAVSPVAGTGASAPTAGSSSGSAGQAPARAAGSGGAAAVGSVPSTGSSGTAAVPQAGARAPQGGAGQPAATGGGAGSAGAGTVGGVAGSGGSTGRAGAPAAGSGGSSSPATTNLEHFSFFITSYAGLQKLSGKPTGFGGDLRYGQADGLTGADKICSDLAESTLKGAAAKKWHAFLSASEGPDGKPVNAIDRIGEGPWYDRIGRIVAMNKAALLNTRPMGADPAIINDLPNEEGVPNQTPDPGQGPVNNHHILTGSDGQGKLYNDSVMSTCMNWTTTAQSAGRPRVGFSYPAGNRQHWISGQDEGGCGAGAVLVDMGGSDPKNPIVGSGGGYGGFYCFALEP